jgi:hypothetical protein
MSQGARSAAWPAFRLLALTGGGACGGARWAVGLRGFRRASSSSVAVVAPPRPPPHAAAPGGGGATAADEFAYLRDPADVRTQRYIDAENAYAKQAMRHTEKFQVCATVGLDAPLRLPAPAVDREGAPR